MADWDLRPRYLFSAISANIAEGGVKQSDCRCSRAKFKRTPSFNRRRACCGRPIPRGYPGSQERRGTHHPLLKSLCNRAPPEYKISSARPVAFDVKIIQQLFITNKTEQVPPKVIPQILQERPPLLFNT